MKAFYLKKLRTSIHDGLSVETMDNKVVIKIEHPKLLESHYVELLPIDGKINMDTIPMKSIVHAVMGVELDEMRRCINSIRNIGWWLALVSSAIMIIWIAKFY